MERKKIFDNNDEVIISVIKGSVDNKSTRSQYQVDGLSGATITSNGISNLLTFWLGKLGYLTFIQQFKDSSITERKTNA